MPQISQSIEINATPEECYQVIFDFESYPDYLKESKEVTVEKKSAHTVDVTFGVEIIKKITYTLKMVGKPPKKINWNLVRGDLMKKNSGSWTFESMKRKSGTKATYDLDVEFGLFVPGAIAKMLIGSNLPDMLKAVKQRIESLSKKKK